MLLAIVIVLLTAYIVIPLVELITKEPAQFFAKMVVYILAFAYVLYLLFVVHVG